MSEELSKDEEETFKRLSEVWGNDADGKYQIQFLNHEIARKNLKIHETEQALTLSQAENTKLKAELTALREGLERLINEVEGNLEAHKKPEEGSTHLEQDYYWSRKDNLMAQRSITDRLLPLLKQKEEE